MSDTYNEVKAIIKDLLGSDDEKITMEARFREELEADSLDLVELIMAFEDKFGAEISDDDAQNITTVAVAARDTSGAASDTQNAAGQLRVMAQALQNLVGRFTI